MSSFTYLVTGASRGLGLGYTRQLLHSGDRVRVVAGARNPSSADDLQALRKEAGDDRLYILKLDVENPESVAAAVKELEASGFLKNGPLDCLINNAGVARGHFDSPSQT
jgi:NAD(P)-dependent dehydrogenase (short-subunit alcohol dehydrogenase family)